ncbi:S1C family serine protease [Alicyclobacillus sp. ALC3]|uniref:S1C family serine protease n=1 Tax=Alicyclobacillus sp. ALC3 TaxID=2796143 RepID=UPI00237850C2|nr:trypsin-like peptidase domain-containing protein [Alicyclobacillus sp. ALC3]WDL95428.1 trypsin-like peptidase domain-containing protein [Alicyclobacillus sp. ALC3]
MGVEFDGQKPTKPRRNAVPWRLLGVVVLSALVGSGATLAALPILQQHTGYLASPSGLAPSSGVSQTSSGAQNVSVNVNSQITSVVKQVEPDVVAVVNYTSASNYFNSQPQLQESDIGSGVYFANNANYAYIVTNNHVVAGGSKVEVVLQSGKHVNATVVGTDEFTDLAVLKVPISNFKGAPPVQFTNSIQVGEPAIAIGNPMGLDFADSVTSGIISGEKRLMPVETPSGTQTLDYQPVLQTDAAINPGNSGGPLLNIQGQVMGINSSKIVATGFEGMGFAIPASEVQTITSEIIKTGHAVHPAIGIGAESLTSLPQGMWPNVPVSYGVYVAQVDSANAKASGLKAGDVIVSLNGQTVQSAADLRTDLFKLQPGQTVQLVVYRGPKKLTLHVTIGTEKTANTTGSNASSSSSSTVPSFGNGSSGGSGSSSGGYGSGSSGSGLFNGLAP